ncbi:hypothetical protein FGADI_733 [Fusarium gaditjirri]|uniref:DUF6603 domain-containing protein n=1 Tax=Fusarium gaditjirri TaxID=282569 RepID=A0A8H4TML7_9HYPO|nr:hypothetical protein FGADI_733 [Fusarium gaditjirri]
MTSVVVIPMAIQAFSVSAFDQSNISLAPMAQLDLERLNAKRSPIAYDLIDHLDTSNQARFDSRVNTRFVNVRTPAGGTSLGGQPITTRQGIYLSWCMPQAFRAGITPSGNNSLDENERIRKGYKGTAPQTNSPGDPNFQFRPVPNRWVIIRTNGKDPLQTLIVESDCVRDATDSVFTSPYDVASLASTTIDPTQPLTQQRSFLGSYAKLGAYIADQTQYNYRSQPLTLVQPGDEFFLDQQPTNINVFSVWDSLEDLTQGSGGATPQNLSYMVVGYHSDMDLDPLVLCTPLSTGSPTNEDILAALGVTLPTADIDFLSETVGPATGRTICHGVLRNVEWGGNQYNLSTPSLDLQTSMTASQPVSVGLDGLDALAGLLNAQGTNVDSTVMQFINQLSAITTSGYNSGGDNVDQVHQAVDLSSSGWSAVASGGSVWKLPDKSRQDGLKAGDSSTINGLLPLMQDLNEQQMAIDACVREKDQVLRQLYGAWWNATTLTLLHASMYAQNRTIVRSAATAAVARLAVLNTTIATLTKSLATLTATVEKKLNGKGLVKTQAEAFGRRQDPTVLFAGTSNGWPDDFHEAIVARLASDIPDLADNTSLDIVGDTLSDLQNSKFPSFLADTVSRLLNDFLQPDASQKPWTASSYAYLEDAEKKQGWFPLFIEWEVEYYHISFDNWEFVPNTTTGTWQWQIKQSNVLAEDPAASADNRRMSGRATIVPQVGLTLQASVRQFLDLQPPGSVKETDRAAILQAAGQLEYLSTPIGGFIDHLLTLRRGHYPAPSAQDKSILDTMGITADDLSQLNVLYGVAPYGSGTNLDPSYTNSFSPFKPVVHGQARFTRLTLVDKFGQVVVAVKPDGGPSDYNAADPWPEELYPCLSPMLTCDMTADGSANTVVTVDTKNTGCQFFQLPPGINQPSRLNASYMVPGATTVASEWDNPVWGWLVPNYIDETIQIFDGTGGFVTEIGIQKSSFSMPAGIAQITPQGRLADLVNALSGNENLAQSIYTMMADATDSLLSTAADFANLLPAAFGRPFCLADVGVSIELSTPALTDTSLLTSSTAEQEPPVMDYTFQVALGNSLAAFDGLVATFASTGSITSFTSTASESGADSDSDSSQSAQTAIALKPFFIPGDHKNTMVAHAKQRVRVSCVVDPILPLHVYSGDLFPVQPVSLPGWAVTDALVPRVPEIVSGKETGIVQMPLASMVPDCEAAWWWSNNSQATTGQKIAVQGNGDSAVHILCSQNGGQTTFEAAVLVDGGRSFYRYNVLRYLNWMQNEYAGFKLTSIVITHWDDDHYGGIMQLFAEELLQLCSAADAVLYMPSLGCDQKLAELEFELQNEGNGNKGLYRHQAGQNSTRVCSVKQGYACLGIDMFSGLEQITPATTTSLTGVYNKQDNLLQAHGRPIFLCIAIDGFILGNDALAQQPVPEPNQGSRNDSSIALIAIWPEKNGKKRLSLYSAGDSTKLQETALFAWLKVGVDEYPQIDMAKLSHHGASTSTPAEIAAFNIQYMYISAGRMHGHPTASLLTFVMAYASYLRMYGTQEPRILASRDPYWLKNVPILWTMPKLNLLNLLSFSPKSQELRNDILRFSGYKVDFLAEWFGNSEFLTCLKYFWCLQSFLTVDNIAYLEDLYLEKYGRRTLMFNCPYPPDVKVFEGALGVKSRAEVVKRLLHMVNFIVVGQLEKIWSVVGWGQGDGCLGIEAREQGVIPDERITRGRLAISVTAFDDVPGDIPDDGEMEIEGLPRGANPMALTTMLAAATTTPTLSTVQKWFYSFLGADLAIQKTADGSLTNVALSSAQGQLCSWLQTSIGLNATAEITGHFDAATSKVTSMDLLAITASVPSLPNSTNIFSLFFNTSNAAYQDQFHGLAEYPATGSGYYVNLGAGGGFVFAVDGTTTTVSNVILWGSTDNQTPTMAIPPGKSTITKKSVIGIDSTVSVTINGTVTSFPSSIVFSTQSTEIQIRTASLDIATAFKWIEGIVNPHASYSPSDSGPSSLDMATAVEEVLNDFTQKFEIVAIRFVFKTASGGGLSLAKCCVDFQVNLTVEAPVKSGSAVPSKENSISGAVPESVTLATATDTVSTSRSTAATSTLPILFEFEWTPGTYHFSGNLPLRKPNSVPFQLDPTAEWVDQPMLNALPPNNSFISISALLDIDASKYPSGIPDKITEAKITLEKSTTSTNLTLTAGVVCNGTQTGTNGSDIPAITFDLLDVYLGISLTSRTPAISLALSGAVSLQGPGDTLEERNWSSLGVDLAYNNESSSWNVTASAYNLSFANMYSLFAANSRSAIADIFSEITILDANLTYTYEKSQPSQLDMLAEFLLGPVLLTLKYKHMSGSVWTFNATISEYNSVTSSATCTLGELFSDLLGKDEALPDFISNLAIPLSDISVNLRCESIDGSTEMGTAVIFSLDLSIGDTILTFAQLQPTSQTTGSESRNEHDSDSQQGHNTSNSGSQPLKPTKAPPARILRFALPQIPGVDDIPVVGHLAPPVNEIAILWANRDVTIDEATVLSENAFTTALPLLFNQFSPQSSTTKPGDVVALAAGCHLQLAASIQGKQKLVLDHIVEETEAKKAKNNKLSPTSSKVPSRSASPASSSTKDSPTPTSDTTSQSSTVAPMRKQAGPLSISSVALQMNSDFKSIALVLTATLRIGPLSFSLIDLGLSLDLSTIKSFSDFSLLQFTPTLSGLALSLDKPPSLDIEGLLVKEVEKDATCYVGGLKANFETWGALAVGMYQEGKSFNDMFAFAHIQGLIAELGWAEINGLSAGLGYNTKLVPPDAADINQWPFIALNHADMAPQSDLATELHSLIQPSSGIAYVVAKQGSYWLAVGLTLLAFKVLDVDAVLSVEMTDSDDCIINITAEATTYFPNTGSEADAFILVDIGATTTLDTAQGYLFAQGQLTPLSYVLSKDCHLTGGIVYATWISPNQYEGDFVVSVGGFNPKYKPPVYYPVAPPRVGISWAYDSDLNILGQAYFAVTPACLMGGAYLDAQFDCGWLKASFSAWADFFLQLHPFWFDVNVGFQFSAEIHLGWSFLAINLGPLTFGADLHLWGPSVSGTATLHFWSMSHTISFGSTGSGAAPAKLDVDAFLKLVRNQGSSSSGDGTADDYLFAITAGTVSTTSTTSTTTITTSQTNDYITEKVHVRGAQLNLVIKTRVPILSASFNAPKGSTGNSETIDTTSSELYAAPMQLTTSFTQSRLVVQLTGNVAGSEMPKLLYNPITTKVPPTLWGFYSADLASAANTPPIPHTTGYSIQIGQQPYNGNGLPIITFTTYSADNIVPGNQVPLAFQPLPLPGNVSSLDPSKQAQRATFLAEIKKLLINFC